MSFFNANGPGGSWGNMLKQAMNTVESKFDKALDIGEGSVYQGEVYVDPVTGFVTTLDPPSSTSQTITKSTQNNNSSQKSISLIDSESKDLSIIHDNIIEQSKSLKNELETDSLKSEITIQSHQSREINGIDSSRTSHDSRTSTTESQLTTDNFQHIIEQRERQLLSATEQNALLNNTIEQLRNQLQELDETKNAELKIVKDHVEGLENLLKGANKELDVIRQQQANKENPTIQNLLEIQRKLLLEKDEQITGLLSEGEKLSKSELLHRTSLKKYRTKEVELENNFADIQRKFEKATSEVTDLTNRLKQLQDSEKKHISDIKRLEDDRERKLQQNLKLEIDLAVSKEERSNLQRLLDKSNEELQEALSTNSIASMQAQTAALEKEASTLVRIEEQAGLREDNLRNEILSLQKQLQIAENCAPDSTSDEWEMDRIQVLKQIEDVKTQYALLTTRLTEVEVERDQYIEECKKLNSQLRELSHSEQKELELISELIAAQQKNSQLKEEIELLNSQIPILNNEIKTLTSKLESSEEYHQKSFKEAEEQYRCMLRKTLEEKQNELEEKLRSEQEESKSKDRGLEKNEFEQKFHDLNERYDTALELLGEKTEKVEELQADIQDMKDAYRSQITDLIAQLEKFK
ncbi:307_t:CDS:10, partial [Scutellospora calospora]